MVISVALHVPGTSNTLVGHVSRNAPAGNVRTLDRLVSKLKGSVLHEHSNTCECGIRPSYSQKVHAGGEWSRRPLIFPAFFLFPEPFHGVLPGFSNRRRPVATSIISKNTDLDAELGSRIAITAHNLVL